ncbi:MarR family transcriptional regulator, organic hydroperoxide resistance regulator [Staphylococcus saprophyticus]|mgnify:FL=1|uniref:HTH-type transcriptional regulator SarZ n=1 Tax=Staphylococcus saprophyticus subsp. saprophyticus (strain ATCC 15305 / DSM 20229 / NCIMB 8711 / NCTC 7292 / S-41) TaxID=342451 RepID=SARZ_STAS1|nr:MULTISPECIES: MarR family transcriptional regulator [Staphylococcus]Q49ZX3.1 RecName: Full=HTH-type transcriptional regulator SarZ; AltName: Full=Staphylococcal accessory regulator Z [Staphylococcus saprophyticus subsp. saprophyticus ATCC 15305 = NCTC 7292]CRV27165.1 MarR family transcriptional regulator [Streptococcus equi subsp. equi]ASE58633.1 transcriptional regulator [Staphylococcus saprophyticus]ASF19600.1 transcriptional regulator [Staphylococcus saprophyticus]MBM0845160.1 MarR famil
MEEKDNTLERQLCFLFYVSSKEIIKKYTSYLKEFDLTYTGYIVLLAIGVEEKLNIKTLGARVFLDSGTLTPLLKKLEKKGYVTRTREIDDERNLQIALTTKGKDIKEPLSNISKQVFNEFDMEVDEAIDLKETLQNFVNKHFQQNI